MFFGFCWTKCVCPTKPRNIVFVFYRCCNVPICFAKWVHISWGLISSWIFYVTLFLLFKITYIVFVWWHSFFHCHESSTTISSSKWVCKYSIISQLSCCLSFSSGLQELYFWFEFFNCYILPNLASLHASLGMDFGCSFHGIFGGSCCKRPTVNFCNGTKMIVSLCREFFQIQPQWFRAFSNGLLKLFNFSWWLKNNVMFSVIPDDTSFKPVVIRSLNSVIFLFDSILEFCNSCKLFVSMSFNSAPLCQTVVVRSSIFDPKSSNDSIMLTKLLFVNLGILYNH